MIRTALHYHRPQSLSAASSLLAEHAGDVAVIGGGTQLLPKMNRDEMHINHVVDLVGLGLDEINVGSGSIELGARVTYDDVLQCASLCEFAPLLPRVARGVTGGRQILQQGTLIGSACLNAPGTEMPGVFTALRARMRVYGPSGMREVSADEFFIDAFAVALGPGEFVTSAVFNRSDRAGYCKIKHSAGSWPIVTASVLRDVSTGGYAVTLGAVQAVPLRVQFDESDPLEIMVAKAVTAPWSDELAPASYRAAIAGVTARRAFIEYQGATS